MGTLVARAPFRSLLFVVLFALLSACGGGGGGGDGGAPKGNVTGGAKESPTLLAVGTIYNTSVAGTRTAYFRFTTGSRAFTHRVTLGDASYVSWTLYSDAAFTQVLTTCGYSYCDAPVLAANTEYFLAVTNYTGVTDEFTIKITANITGEGAFDAPVTVHVGTDHTGTVDAKKSWGTGISYYAFTTGSSASRYTISLQGATTDLRWMLDAALQSNALGDCDQVWATGDESCVTDELAANHTYYLAVGNHSTSDGTFFKLRITAGGSAPVPFANEGTLNAPVVLTPGTPHTATVAFGGKSYYAFTTDDAIATYSLKIERVSRRISGTFYVDAASTIEVPNQLNCYNGNPYSDVNCSTTALNANSTYYLTIDGTSAPSPGDKFILTVTRNSVRDPNNEGTEITPVELSIGVTHGGTVGKLGTSYYKFTAIEPKSYNIALTNTTADLHWVTLTDWNEIYGQTVCDSTCETPRLDAGQTLYMYVMDGTETGPATFNLLVTPVENKGEGTSTTPVAVTPGTPYASSVAANGVSYYHFTTASEPRAYEIGVTGATADVEWRLYGSGLAGGFPESCDSVYGVGDEVCQSAMLSPNTRYLLEVRNFSGNDSLYTVSVDNGTAATPLALGTMVTGSKPAHGARVYHTFVADAVNTAYTVTLNSTAENAYVYLYSDPLFTNQIAFCYPRTDGNQSCTIRALSPGTTYYVGAYLRTSGGAPADYDLVVNAGDYNEGSIDTPITVALGVERAARVANNGSSYYRFTTASGGKALHAAFSYTGSYGVFFRVYSDPGYTNLVGYCAAESAAPTCQTLSTLATGTTYYLTVNDASDYARTFTFSVTSQ